MQLHGAVPARVRSRDHGTVDEADSISSNDVSEGRQDRPKPLPPVFSCTKRHGLCGVEDYQNVVATRAIVTPTGAVLAKVAEVIRPSGANDIDSLSWKWHCRCLQLFGQPLKVCKVKRRAAWPVDHAAALEMESGGLISNLTTDVGSARDGGVLPWS